MNDPTTEATVPAPARRRFRFGLRGLMASVLVLGIAFGWLAREVRRAEERSALVSELARSRVVSFLDEPTGFALVVRKFAPRSEAWLRERLGPGWFARPTVFVARGLDDEGVPGVVDRLARLGTVREVFLQRPNLTGAGELRLRDGLAGVNVVSPSDRAGPRYVRDQVEREHFAFEAAAVAASLVVGLLGLLFLLLRPLVRRRRPRGRAA
jgi:hypothetical protein